jgi:hypothetical protein
MARQNNPATAYFKQRPSEWDFLPPTFSGAAGVLIGLVIANFLGWL